MFFFVFFRTFYFELVYYLRTNLYIYICTLCVYCLGCIWNFTLDIFIPETFRVLGSTLNFSVFSLRLRYIFTIYCFKRQTEKNMDYILVYRYPWFAELNVRPVYYIMYIFISCIYNLNVLTSNETMWLTFQENLREWYNVLLDL